MQLNKETEEMGRGRGRKKRIQASERNKKERKKNISQRRREAERVGNNKLIKMLCGQSRRERTNIKHKKRGMRETS